jgi:protocatechuate 3,4-dioxygenase beta subunit
MKKYLITVVLILGIAFLWLARYASNQTDVPAVFPASQTHRPGNEPHLPSPSPNQTTSTVADDAWDAETERERQALNTEDRLHHQTPIVFYGLVIDQFATPVAGAAIEYDCVGGSFEGNREMFTNDSGQFTISGVQGKTLRVRATHPNYYNKDFSSEYFTYAGNNRGPNFMPDPANPVIFHLLKKGEAAELIHREDHVLFNGDEPERSFSLIDHSRRRDRPEYVILRRVETAERDNQGRPIRRLEMIVPEGGIQQRLDTFAFTAPADGYQSSLYFMRPTYGGQLDYFVRFNSGNYGRFTIMGSAGDYLIDSYLNPDRSPNLEYDREKQITVVQTGRPGVDLLYPAKKEEPKKP